MKYSVYILKCSDGSYYTGVTNYLKRRVQEHIDGINPTCYTYKRRPLELVYYEHYEFIEDAIMREKQIQKWSRKKKEALINNDEAALKQLAKNRTQYPLTK